VLVYIQSRNFCSNRTTNERFSRMPVNYVLEDRCCLLNCTSMCFNPSALSEPERRYRQISDDLSYQELRMKDSVVTATSM
jgi:hypothetical protein